MDYISLAFLQLNYQNKIILEQSNVHFALHQHYTLENKNIFILVKAGNRQKQKFLDWLYEDAKIYLNRKYKQYIELIKENERINKICLSGKQGFRKQLVDPKLTIKSKFDENDEKLIFDLINKGYSYKRIEKEYLLNRIAISKLIKRKALDNQIQGLT